MPFYCNTDQVKQHIPLYCNTDQLKQHTPLYCNTDQVKQHMLLYWNVLMFCEHVKKHCALCTWALSCLIHLLRQRNIRQDKKKLNDFKFVLWPLSRNVYDDNLCIQHSICVHVITVYLMFINSQFRHLK